MQLTEMYFIWILGGDLSYLFSISVAVNTTVFNFCPPHYPHCMNPADSSNHLTKVSTSGNLVFVVFKSVFSF